MVSQRALYWIAVGLMVPLLGNHFAVRASNQASVLAGAERMLERTLGFAAFGAGISSFETRFASLEAQIAHRQAACARLQAERARMMAIEQTESGRVPRICPRSSLRITTPVHLDAGGGSI